MPRCLAWRLHQNLRAAGSNAHLWHLVSLLAGEHYLGIPWYKLVSTTGLISKTMGVMSIFAKPSRNAKLRRSMVSRRHKGQASKRRRTQIWMDRYLRRKCCEKGVCRMPAVWVTDLCRAIAAEFAKRRNTCLSTILSLQIWILNMSPVDSCRTSQVDPPSSSISRRVQTNYLTDSFLNLFVSPKATGHAMLKPAPEEAVKGRKKKRWKSRPAVSSPIGSW